MLVGPHGVFVHGAEAIHGIREVTHPRRERVGVSAERCDLRLEGQETVDLGPQLESRVDLGEEVAGRCAGPLDLGGHHGDVGLGPFLGVGDSGRPFLSRRDLLVEALQVGGRLFETGETLFHGRELGGAIGTGVEYAELLGGPLRACDQRFEGGEIERRCAVANLVGGS